MPTPEQIHAALTDIANNWRGLAIFWHEYFAGCAAAVLMRRISVHHLGMCLVLPLLSVSALAWFGGNAFTGVMFLVTACVLSWIALRLPRAQLRPVALPYQVAGVLMFLFGWTYPHFVNTSSLLPYLYEAPTGLIPCPTLSILIGIGLAAGGLSSRSWSLALAALSAFYGLYGVFVLAVGIDVILAAGAVVLCAAAFTAIPARRNTR